MPEHTSLLHYLLYRMGFKDSPVRESFFAHEHLGYREYEPLFMSLLIMLVVIYLAAETRAQLRKLKEAVIPEEELTMRTFFEVFLEYFYGMARDVMGSKNATRYFPLIGGAALFILFSNAIGLIPGFLPPTSSLNITAGCAILVFLAFNYYGIRENGIGYLKHMAGWGTFHGTLPNVLLALLIFPIELISICVRPVTLAIRLMVNIAVDHMVVSAFLGLFALFVPVPSMLLGVLVILVQTLVFCLLTSIYIGLATAHEEHH
jgi:F-type H+-transporting ATPase subunit a